MRTRLVKRGMLGDGMSIVAEVLDEGTRGDLKLDEDSSRLSGCRMSMELLQVLPLYPPSPLCLLLRDTSVRVSHHQA
jgi:hypothetical protein